MMPLKIREGNNLCKAIQLISVYLRSWDFSILFYKAAKTKWKKQMMHSEKQPQPPRLFLEVYLISGHIFSLIVIESILSLRRGINVKKPKIQGRE